MSEEHKQCEHGIMGRRFPDGGLLRYRKWVPQQLGDVNKQESGDSRPMGAWHGDTAANHTDLLSGCGRTCVFAVQAWSNMWDLISEPPSHYSMGLLHSPWWWWWRLCLARAILSCVAMSASWSWPRSRCRIYSSIRDTRLLAAGSARWRLPCCSRPRLERRNSTYEDNLLWSIDQSMQPTCLTLSPARLTASCRSLTSLSLWPPSS